MGNEQNLDRPDLQPKTYEEVYNQFFEFLFSERQITYIENKPLFVADLSKVGFREIFAERIQKLISSLRYYLVNFISKNLSDKDLKAFDKKKRNILNKLDTLQESLDSFKKDNQDLSRVADQGIGIIYQIRLIETLFADSEKLFGRQKVTDVLSEKSNKEATYDGVTSQ